MINKLVLGIAVCLGSMTVAASVSDAGGCHYRHARVYRAPVVVSRPYRAAYRGGYYYGAPAYRYSYPGYRPSSYYGPAYGSYIGPGVGVGYRGYGGYGGYGYGRSGVSIGIGF